MHLVHDARAEDADTLDCGVETGVSNQQGHAVSGWLRQIADGAVVAADLKPVQLHNQLPVDQQQLIFGAAVPAGRAEHMLVPPARRFYICHGDHRLGRMNRPLSSVTDRR